MGTQFKVGEHKLLCCSVLDDEARISHFYKWERFNKDGFDIREIEYVPKKIEKAVYNIEKELKNAHL